MQTYIDVDAAGMFSPQDEGPCKLTLIIKDREDQAFAFSKLRYAKVRVGLIPEDADTDKPDPLKDVEQEEAALERLLKNARDRKVMLQIGDEGVKSIIYTPTNKVDLLEEEREE